MRILVTRPQDAAAEFAAALQAIGHQTLCASLLTVRLLDGPEPDLQGVAAIVVTSANGVRALARRTPRRDLPLIAVGPQTAQAGRLSGFAHVESADGNAELLAEALPRWIPPQAGKILHAAGSDAGDGLPRRLVAKGYDVRQEVFYEVTATPSLPVDAARALGEGAIDAAFFFSPRSAKAFRKAVGRAGLETSCMAMIAICISAPTAQALAPLTFREVRIAEKPNRDALLQVLALPGDRD
ncbi:MAG: uroporphyrinogen-III synthase [Alphaproteobacteria bacterium]|nr:uroporphyrinogen-III synthase [Alphaproteobacteria bacterium]